MAEVENLDKVIAKLAKLVDETTFKETMNKACIVVENQAKINAPAAAGQLRNSITHEVDGLNGYIGTNVSYAPYVEFGTGIFAAEGNGRQDRWSYQDAKGNWHSTIGQKPQPFLEPALEASKDKVFELFQEALKKGVSGND